MPWSAYLLSYYVFVIPKTTFALTDLLDQNNAVAIQPVYSVRALGICTDQLCGRSNDALVSDKTYRGTSITSVLWEKPSAWQQCRIQDWGNWDGAREDEERKTVT